jgi:hypothetical protein
MTQRPSERITEEGTSWPDLHGDRLAGAHPSERTPAV